MGEYFKPWRRKIGVVTLVLACVFACGWVRSLSNFDQLSAIDNDDCWLVIAQHWEVYFQKNAQGSDEEKVLLHITLGVANSGIEIGGLVFISRFGLPLEFHQRIPHWSTAILLTLLSAWLLLSKPRKVEKAAPTPT